MAPEKDNYFQPNPTPRIASTENTEKSAEFLRPTERSVETNPEANNGSLVGTENHSLPAIDQTIYETGAASESLPTNLVSTDESDPMSAYFNLIEGGISPHNTVSELNKIRKSA